MEAAHGPSAHPKEFARRAALNQKAMLAFIAALTALAFVFVAFQLARRFDRGQQTGVLVTLSRYGVCKF